MKKLISAILIIILLFSLVSCKEQSAPQTLSVVTTSFAAYDWTRNVIGDTVSDYDITLLGGGVDMHSYAPSAEDIVAIAGCDLFIYVGGESDGWVDKVSLKEGAEVIRLIDDTPRPITVTDDHGHETTDEHVWMSLNNAQVLCKSVSDALSRIYPEHAVAFDSNRESYALKLVALEKEYIAAFEGYTLPSIIVADRNPFNYLLQNCENVGAYCAFDSCTTDAEASFDMIMRLSNTAKSLNAHALVVTESADNAIANTVIQTAGLENCKINTLDSMQSVTTADIQNGATYLDISKSNLEILKESVIEEKLTPSA